MAVWTDSAAPSLAAVRATPPAVTVHHDPAAIVALWGDLARFGSAYASPGFLLPWLTHVAPGRGIEPRLGVVRDSAGAVVAFLPFGLVRYGPVRTAIYLGGRDANLNAPLLGAGFLPSEAEARDVLRACADAMSPRPDLFVLANQPRDWQGVANPFVFAGSTPSASAAFAGPLPADAAAMASFGSKDARKKLRAKAAKLAACGPLSFLRVPPAEAAGFVDTLTQQKQARLGARGIDAGLTAPAMRCFLLALANPDSGPPVLDLYALTVSGTPAAIFGGLPWGRHWHGLLISMTDEPAIARCSPGDLLLRHVMGDLAERGFTTFDLGIGEARYKDAVCPERIALFDTVMPVTALGRGIAAGKGLQLAAKRWLKGTPWALAAARRVQGLLARR